jgi:cytosine/adenosine deaminase-related metal-dependent hydrolase
MPRLQFRPLKLERYGLLDSSILLSHAAGVTPEEAEAIKRHKVPISSTPSTELQTAMGYPVALCGPPDLQSLFSLGVDCHSMTSSSMPFEMRILLQTSRAFYNQRFVEAKKNPVEVNKTVEEAFNLGTIAGARALQMEDQIGSLAVGKRADIVVFDATSPSMAVAAQYDPVAAIVLHSSPRDVVMTLVDGVVRKEKGVLSTVRVTEEEQRWVGRKGSLE